MRRAQACERVTITVSGRPAAQLGPVQAEAWVAWAAVAEVLAGPGDPSWDATPTCSTTTSATPGSSDVERGVLDTRVLIAVDVAALPGQLAVSAISFAELHDGVLVATSEQARTVRLSRLTRIQRRFDPLPVHDAVADSYGQLAGLEGSLRIARA